MNTLISTRREDAITDNISTKAIAHSIQQKLRCLALEILVQGYLTQVTGEPEKVWEVDPSTT